MCESTRTQIKNIKDLLENTHNNKVESCQALPFCGGGGGTSSPISEHHTQANACPFLLKELWVEAPPLSGQITQCHGPGKYPLHFPLNCMTSSYSSHTFYEYKYACVCMCVCEYNLLSPFFAIHMYMCLVGLTSCGCITHWGLFRLFSLSQHPLIASSSSPRGVVLWNFLHPDWEVKWCHHYAGLIAKISQGQLSVTQKTLS